MLQHFPRVSKLIHANSIANFVYLLDSDKLRMSTNNPRTPKIWIQNEVSHLIKIFVLYSDQYIHTSLPSHVKHKGGLNSYVSTVQTYLSPLEGDISVVYKTTLLDINKALSGESCDNKAVCMAIQNITTALEKTIAMSEKSFTNTSYLKAMLISEIPST